MRRSVKDDCRSILPGQAAGKTAAHRHEGMSRWQRYYQASAAREPRPLFLAALDQIEKKFNGIQPRFAIDLGCGAGAETLALLARGWRVLAIDKEIGAIQELWRKIPCQHRDSLEARVMAFEEVALPAADFVYAGFSLPFCRPRHFEPFWSEIERSLAEGRFFAGQFFGPRDSWAADPTLTVHTEADVRSLLRHFDIECFREVEYDGKSFSGAKHWHMFAVMARRSKNAERSRATDRSGEIFERSLIP